MFNAYRAVTIRPKLLTPSLKILFSNGTGFFPQESTFFSPNGRFVCFLVFKLQEEEEQPQELKRVQFLDLVHKSQNGFEFPDENLLRVNSVYWLTDNLIVFLSTDGKSFTQTMYRVEIQETPCMQKVCERVYVLPNEIFKDFMLPATSKILFDGEDERTEYGNCTGLYLIPRNPTNQNLRIRKFAMNLNTKTNPIFKKDEIMQEFEVSEKGRIMNYVPFIRHNQLLFRICYKDSYDDDEDFPKEFVKDKFLMGVFLSVKAKNLKEVEGLDYDQKEVRDDMGAYTIYAWTDLMKQYKMKFDVNTATIQQVGKYLLFVSSDFGIRCDSFVINLEDHSYSHAIIESEHVFVTTLHPFGIKLKIEQLEKQDEDNDIIDKEYPGYSLNKTDSQWKYAKLEDIARRNVILNEDFEPFSIENYLHVIYQ